MKVFLVTLENYMATLESIEGAYSTAHKAGVAARCLPKSEGGLTPRVKVLEVDAPLEVDIEHIEDIFIKARL